MANTANADDEAGRAATMPASEPGEALSRISWLRQVPAATLGRLAQQAVLHRVPSGSILFEQSETPAFAQLLMTGCVDLLAVNRTSQALIETVHPVDLLLPAAVLNRQPYLARAYVVAEAQLLLVHAEAFRDAVVTDQALCLAVLACQAAQFRRQVKLAKNLKLRSAEERVGCYLMGLLQDMGPQMPARLPLEKRRIAWQLGMTRETLSRTLAAMTRFGLCVTGDIVEVTDAVAAHAHFPLDPLIDGPESMTPLPVGST